MERRSTEVLMNLLYSSPKSYEKRVFPLFTGEEIMILERELESICECFYNVHGHEVEEKAIYEVRLFNDVYSFARIAHWMSWRDVMHKLSKGATFLYKGIAYHRENREELPRWEDGICLVDYVYEDEKYLFMEEDVVKNIIEENQREVEKEKKEIEAVRQAVAKNRNLMLSISLGAEKFPQRA